MNCPYCKKPIGGYVELGSVEYSRVSKGCCPHCGSPMPAGYRVGFPKAESRRVQPPISRQEFEKRTANSTIYGCMMTVAGLLAGISFIVGNAIVRPWMRYTVGILYIIVAFFFSFVFYFAVRMELSINNIWKDREYNADSIFGKGWLIASLLADALMIYISMGKHPVVRMFDTICLAVCGLLLLLTILIRRKRG